jgi:hypothetical protein
MCLIPFGNNGPVNFQLIFGKTLENMTKKLWPEDENANQRKKFVGKQLERTTN